MKEIKFEKWQGLGNDFIILPNDTATGELAKIMCDRNFGIGADGLFSPTKPEGYDIGWEFFNSDGSVAQMCGNGIRCFARFAKNSGLVDKDEFSVKTLAGKIIPKIVGENKVRVDMGKPILEAGKIPVNVENPLDFKVEGFSASAVSMGNPHCVIFVEKDSDKLAKEIGPKIESHSLFPEKTNVEFIKIKNKNNIRLDVYERGCGITLACGTGACAGVVAGIKKGLLNNIVNVELPGGELVIEYNGENVYMTGEAKKVFEGIFYLD